MERISCMSASLLIYFPSRRGHHHGWSRECKQTAVQLFDSDEIVVAVAAILVVCTAYSTCWYSNMTHTVLIVAMH